MGDPAGIGPEILIKALQHPEVYEVCRPTVYGDLDWMRRTALASKADIEILEEAIDTAPRPRRILVRQATDADLSDLQPGVLSAQAGRAAAQCVIRAAEAAMHGECDGIVTAPLHKEAIALGGFPYPGHTELLAEATGTPRYGMLLLSGALRVVHVSTHVSLREAIARVKAARILECIRLGHAACRALGMTAPRIAVAGLNPHAGEHGLFGGEEIEEITPAVEQALQEGMQVGGPYPPDTVFARAAQGEFDLVVAMYHDQGHIPVKLHGFDEGVNVTIGLPIVRVSVDHGTAFDIAGKGVARENSLIEAIRIAALLAVHRDANLAPPSNR